MWVFAHFIWLWDFIEFIRRSYLSIEAICAECNLFSCIFFLAKWLFRFVELVDPFEARFISEWCVAFLLALCLSNRIFNSVELEWLGLEEKNKSALWSKFFLQRLFLIKGRWFITFLSRGNPVPCCPNMHFQEEIERDKSVAVDTILFDQGKYLIFWFLFNLFGLYSFFFYCLLGSVVLDPSVYKNLASIFKTKIYSLVWAFITR